MSPHERAAFVFAQMAALSHRKGQQPARDRFLILTGIEAVQSGWLDVAEQARKVVLSNSPHHLLGRSASFADAVRSEEFPDFERSLRRFCSFERAEHLLSVQPADELEFVSASAPVAEQTSSVLAVCGQPADEE